MAPLQHRTRIVLVDSHRAFLELFSARLESDPRFEMAGSASDGEEGQRLVHTARPDLAVYELDLAGPSAFEMATEIAATALVTRVVVLSSFVTDVFVEEALRTGVAGYLTKHEPVDTLTQSLRRIDQGEVVLSEEIRQRIVDEEQTHRQHLSGSTRLSLLTRRQMEVLRPLARGQSVKEIATSLGLANKSVESHKYRLMKKLDIHDRLELARFVIREGLQLP